MSVNSELKQLFGPVIEKETIEDASIYEPFDVGDWQHTRKECQSAMQTEKYWMLGQKDRKNRVHVLRKAPHVQTNPPETPTSKLLIEFVSSNPNRAPTIPFDAFALDSIPKYPLVCKKATTDQTDETLKAKLPSISKILTATMSEGSRYILKRWKLEKIAELGEDGFREYKQKTLSTGQQFHTSIQTYFEQEQLPDANSPVYTLWQSIGGVLIELDPKPIMIEKSVVHPYLKYKGIIDNVAVIK